MIIQDCKSPHWPPVKTVGYRKKGEKAPRSAKKKTQMWTKNHPVTWLQPPPLPKKTLHLDNPCPDLEGFLVPYHTDVLEPFKMGMDCSYTSLAELGPSSK